MQIQYLTVFNNFFESNTKLAFSIAMRFKTNDYTQIDVIQAANMGLMKAIKKFDPQMGFKFSTYATWWIRQNSLRHICDNESTIRKPVHAIGTLRKITVFKRNFELLNGREPRAEEISEELGLTVKRVEDLLLGDYTSNPISLEVEIGDEEDTTLGEFIPDSEPSPQETVINQMLKEETKKILSTLTEREAYVLTKRFGLDGDGTKTLEDVGIELGVTRERIRQIEAKALRTLRHSSRSKRLEDFIE